jgi:uracil-DNA glycosylase
MNKIDKTTLLDELKKKMTSDDSLPLKKGATNLVFGVGNPETEILFIGEGPGYWEDQKAEPFVGNAGKLLDSLLLSIKVGRSDVYITNVVHHRPPENRDPLLEEIKAYGKYLDEIIKIIDPKIVVTLGRFSMAKFLPDARISSVHGRKYYVSWNAKDKVIVPMYHPAAGLRSGEVKQQLIADFKKLPAILEEVRNGTGKNTVEKEKKLEQMELI